MIAIVLATNPVGCGDQRSSPEIAKTAPATEPAPESKAAPSPEAQAEGKPEADEPPATVANAVTFTVDDQERRLELREPTQATINRLVNPPAVVILARGEGDTESMMINLSGINLDRAKVPHEVKGERASKLRFVYVDPNGSKETGGVETDSGDHFTIDTWDAKSRRLRARFAITLGTKNARGTLDVVLHNPFEH